MEAVTFLPHLLSRRPLDSAVGPLEAAALVEEALVEAEQC